MVISAAVKQRFGACSANGTREPGTKIWLSWRRRLQAGACPEWDEWQGCAKTCHVKSCHAMPCQAVPCRPTPAGNTLMSPGPAARLGTGSQPGGGIREVLVVLVEGWHRQKETWQLCLQGEERSMHKSRLCTLWVSLDNTVACRYRFAGLCVKGFTVFIINTINRFVVLL